MRSLLSNETDLKILLSDLKPDIVLLSETWLNNSSRVKFPGYNIIRDDRDDGYGGLLSLIKIKYKFQRLSLDTTSLLNSRIETQSFKLIFDNSSEFFFLNMYINPTSKFLLNNLLTFFESNNLVGKPLFWASDCNAEHPLWGYPSSDPRGEVIVNPSHQLERNVRNVRT